MVLEIKVRPSSPQDGLINFREPKYLEIAVRAKAEKNEANQALINFLSKILEIPKEDIKILKGKGSPKKLVSVQGLTENQLREKLKR